MYDKPWICIYCKEEFTQPIDNCTSCFRSEVWHKHRYEKLQEEWKKQEEYKQKQKQELQERRFRESFPEKLRQYQLQKQVHFFWAKEAEKVASSS